MNFFATNCQTGLTTNIRISVVAEVLHLQAKLRLALCHEASSNKLLHNEQLVTQTFFSISLTFECVRKPERSFDTKDEKYSKIE